jgi:hypothetical protein
MFLDCRQVAQEACILHPPAHIVTVVLLGDMIKGTLCSSSSSTLYYRGARWRSG